MGESAWLMYKTSNLAGPPANGLASSCVMISWDTRLTSLINVKSVVDMYRQSEPGLVSRPYAISVSARLACRPTMYTRNFVPCFVNVLASARAI
jgi:hypothetical protein